MNANNEEDHCQQAAARAARAVTRAVTRAAAITADDDVDVAADVDAAARVVRFGRVDAADVDAAVDAVAAAVAAAPPRASFLGLDGNIRVNILNYLGETNDELITLTLVSKQVNKACKQPGIEWKIIPTFEIRPRPQGASTLAFLQQLCHYLNTRRYHISYTHMRVYDVHKITRSSGQSEDELLEEDQEDDQAFADITKSYPSNPFYSILSLDISLAKPIIVPMFLPNILTNILPNLREINLSNISTNVSLQHLLNNIPHLEKLTWNNIIDYTDDQDARLCGWNMREAKNLKEIIMDDFKFSRMPMPMSMINNTRNVFIFFRCSKALERVSIRNMKWNSEVVVQDALIKFVRNVPTLRWFRSDLTIENRNMLNLERPEIELLN
ncbi:hypothetical protein FRACYDRAFT_263880 [Fragilariopsis cylindrus CCMP1102]|uniref:Uncharacterized protein n=1 Tax=Fragilariopsis cylindrus CCMP1102 TaxID=635003 RepID=A0A1E7EWK3_9STRA|nr:hypothetical protein FRACYDRAFT_263880 [Fragilariopsis cylindrus CCMP1102]|eukprot:OEU10408.1 hypothetical protein FRACYDRAFT_263880 [Fragilariopsis cylindrus CCMP1102]